MIVVKYVGKFDVSTTFVGGRQCKVKRGETIEVSEDAAVQLLELGAWTPGDDVAKAWLKELKKVEADRVKAEEEAAKQAAADAAAAAESEG